MVSFVGVCNFVGAGNGCLHDQLPVNLWVPSPYRASHVAAFSLLGEKHALSDPSWEEGSIGRLRGIPPDSLCVFSFMILTTWL